MKKPIDNASFFVFFSQQRTQFGPYFASKTTSTLFVLLIFKEIYWEIQLILITCVATSSSENKFIKPPKIAIFVPNLHKKRSVWATPKMKNIFLAELIKTDHQLPETFCFIKISYALAELWIFFHFLWCFDKKGGHFQLKQLVWVSHATFYFLTQKHMSAI